MVHHAEVCVYVSVQNECATKSVSTRRVLQSDGHQQERPAEGQALHLIHRRRRVCSMACIGNTSKTVHTSAIK